MNLEVSIEWAAVAISAVALVLALRRPPLKERLLVFFLKGYVSIFLSVIINGQGRIEYPARLLPQYFQTSILFELLVFPVLCVYYNMTTARSGLGGIAGQAVLYSGAMTAVEVWLERNTSLISYVDWNWNYTFIGLFCTFAGVRSFMAGVRYFAGE